MTEDDELGYTEKVWVFRAALDRDAVAAQQSGRATVWPRNSLAAQQSGRATVWPRNSVVAKQCLGEAAEAVDSTVSAAFFRGRPEQKPRAAL
jgi:hypothetical protein